MLIDAYHDEDVNVAEKSLPGMSKRLHDGQQSQIEQRDYDYTLALGHGRLAILYRHIGRNEDAEEQFRIAVIDTDKSVAKNGGSPSESEQPKREAPIRLIDFLDQNQAVKWKAQSSTSNPAPNSPTTPSSK